MIPMVAVLVLLSCLLAMLMLDHTTPTTPIPAILSKNDAVAGVYWMTALKPDQEAPPRDSFGQSPQTRAVCHLSLLPEQGGMLFIIPVSPCVSIFRSIQIDDEGFHSIVATTHDNTTFKLTALRRDDGVYTVTIEDQKETSRFAICPTWNEGKQIADGQPATAPQSKPEGGEKPKPLR